MLDTNIVLYLLSGDKTLVSLLAKRRIYLSFITELELLGFHELSRADQQHINNFIGECTVIDINASIKKRVTAIQRKSKLKLPDAIIAATADYLGIPLISADKKLKAVKNISMILYEP